MKGAKKIVSIAVVLFVLFLLVIVAVTVFGNRALKSGIEIAAQQALKVEVRLDNVQLSLFRGKLLLNNLVVDNPTGYNHPHLLTLEQAYAEVDIFSLLSDTIEIETIVLDNIGLTFEQKGMTSNLQEILSNLETPGEPSEPKEPSKHVRVRELHINGADINIKLLPIPGRADTVRLHLAPMTLTDIGTDEDISLSQLSGIVMAAIAGGLFDQGKDLLPTDLLKELGTSVRETGTDILKDIEGMGKDLGKEIEDVGKDVEDRVRGIFQR